MRTSLSPWLFLFGCLVAHAAPLERDLGQGLAFYRVHRLPDDLPTSEAARHQACVLDLRYVSGDATSATALAAWLKFHAARATPVFVLANGQTSAPVLRALAEHDSADGVMTVGMAAAGFQPDSAVVGAPERERRAYDALEKGAAVAALLLEHPDKARNDEASLAKEHPVDAVPEDTNAAGDKHPPALDVIDVSLQRAVHLHRALVALRKIK